MKNKDAKLVVIRPKHKHATLHSDLSKLAKKKNDNFNNYVETVLVRHTLRMAQPDTHETE